MATNRRGAGMVSGVTLAALLLALSCGGNAEKSGTAGTGGAAAAGTGGERVETGGAPSGGSHTGGQAAAGQSSGGAQGCLHGGKFYPVGAEFPAGDGCNTCRCRAFENTGTDISCTLVECDRCPGIESSYSANLEAAKRCDPALSVEQCTQRVDAGLICMCSTFVNPQNAVEIKAFQQDALQYSESRCRPDVACGPCMEPTGAYCSPEGRCELARVQPVDCVVNGLRYASGSMGIPDPTSCNKCGCYDGMLGCTEIGCPMPCPPGTSFATGCAECGPTDRCLAVAYGCYPTCIDNCDTPGSVCIDGVCKPGLCG